jgi:hypothetical protein
MRLPFLWLIVIHGWLAAIQPDFDVTVVGTSPVSMLEAIYHLAENKCVLIVESAERCGGAWKSIDICGIPNVDLGCHLVGSDLRLKNFFETYFGCKFVCLTHPDQETDPSHQACMNGFYFSSGCYEMISHLEAAILSRPNGLLLRKKLQSIFIDQENSLVRLNLGDLQYTTAKLILTPAVDVQLDHPQFATKQSHMRTYAHLYLLVDDPTPVRFTYISGILTGMSRAMNLTPFIDMPRSNLQLIAIQTVPGKEREASYFLEGFKAQNLLTEQAQLLAWDTYVYQQASVNLSQIQKLGGGMVELLDSSSFGGIIKYFDKWKKALVPIPME